MIPFLWRTRRQTLHVSPLLVKAIMSASPPSSSSPGTPTSQDLPSQPSASQSPLDLSYGSYSSTSPANASDRRSSALHQSPLVGVMTAPAVNNLLDGAVQLRERSSQSSLREPEPRSYSPPTATSNLSSNIWNSSDYAIPMPAPVQPAESLDTSISPPVAVPVRHDSVDSNSEASDAGKAKREQSEAARTRTTDSAKVRHNIVERRYRENINAQVDVLRDSIVATMQVKDEQNGTSSSRLGADELKRLTKAAVIAAATQQIKRARSENDKLLDEHRLLQAQIRELEKQVKCGECPLMQLSVDMGLESPS